MIDEPWLLLLAAVPLLVGQLWAILDVLRSSRSGLRKLLWIVAIVVFHVFALAAYVLVRPPPPPHTSDHARGSGRAAALVDLVERRVRGELRPDDYERLLAELRQSP